MNPPIVLLTDFGLQDHYVGVTKGAILSLTPNATIVDLCHGVEPQNILQAAILLEISYAFFPKGSIFVCVVDPGVGTSRQLVGVKTAHYYFLGPDNGILTLALAHEDKSEIRILENKKLYGRQMPSATFHGRDILAPIAAHLSKKTSSFSNLGRRLSKLKPLKFPRVRKSEKSLQGEILFFDHFGNAVTNIRQKDATAHLWQKAQIWVRDIPLGKLRITYAHGPRTLSVLFNSASQLELVLPNGSAKREGSLEVGDPVTVKISR